MSTFDDLLSNNQSIIEAYARMGEPEVSYTHPDVKTKVTEDDSVVAHHFDPEHTEKMHDHLTGLGFKQAGSSSASGSSVETRYVHPKTKKVVYVGRNKHTGWVDISK